MHAPIVHKKLLSFSSSFTQFLINLLFNVVNSRSCNTFLLLLVPLLLYSCYSHRCSHQYKKKKKSFLYLLVFFSSQFPCYIASTQCWSASYAQTAHVYLVCIYLIDSKSKTVAFFALYLLQSHTHLQLPNAFIRSLGVALAPLDFIR